MPDQEKWFRRLYEAFNARDVDTLLAAMHPDVIWPNGWEGGHVVGHDAVHDYWSRQWAEVDSTAIPTGFEALPDGRVKVSVHLRGKAPDGTLLWEHEAGHVYTFDTGLISSMEILEPGAADEGNGGA